MRKSLVARLGALTAAGLLLAACSGAGGGGGSASEDAGAGAYGSGSGSGKQDSGKQDSGAQAGGGTAIQVADSDFGQIVTDAEGRALYAFTMDTDGRSMCTAGCDQTWPPLQAEGSPSGADGINADLLSTISREDGTTQVAYKNWPLYYYAEDSGPGETNGQGVGGNWWLVGPDGALIKSETGGDSGY